MSPPLLEVKDLAVHFPVTEGLLIEREVARVRAVDGVSFAIQAGETFSLVGESGCGKTTTALAALRMQDPTGGSVHFDGEDITQLDDDAMRPLRQRMQMVYQDPFSSLNPRMTVRDIVAEPLIVHRWGDKQRIESRVGELLEQVGLLPDMIDRYPHEFSGGQRQRIGIARALALEPSLILCDEPVSALDVSIQAQVINLFMDLQDALGLAYLFISHDLSVVRHMSDRVAVMYLGRIVEIAERDDLFERPRHPYTRALLAAVPVANPAAAAGRDAEMIVGEVPSVRHPPSGCRFHPRCPHALPRCAIDMPELQVVPDASTRVACHLLDEPESSGGN
ncbi:MAG: oligopeptide/dipeptide ABC transporter ATP-binding protein [Pseudomonadota bacterium]